MRPQTAAPGRRGIRAATPGRPTEAWRRLRGIDAAAGMPLVSPEWLGRALKAIGSLLSCTVLWSLLAWVGGWFWSLEVGCGFVVGWTCRLVGIPLVSPERLRIAVKAVEKVFCVFSHAFFSPLWVGYVLWSLES